jgi:hypothetical protein
VDQLGVVANICFKRILQQRILQYLAIMHDYC